MTSRCRRRRQKAELGEHVGRPAHERRPVAQEAVRAFCRGLRRVAGHGHHLPPLVESGPRGGESTAALPRFHHDHRARPARDHAVAAGEVLLPRAGEERELAHDGPVPRDRVGEGGVLRRVEAVEAGAEDRHRAPAAVEGAAVRGGVDAAREARHDRHPGRREVPGERPGEGEAEAGGGARAHHRDRPLALARDEGAADPQDGRGRVDAPATTGGRAARPARRCGPRAPRPGGPRRSRGVAPRRTAALPARARREGPRARRAAPAPRREGRGRRAPGRRAGESPGTRARVRRSKVESMGAPGGRGRHPRSRGGRARSAFSARCVKRRGKGLPKASPPCVAQNPRLPSKFDSPREEAHTHAGVVLSSPSRTRPVVGGRGILGSPGRLRPQGRPEGPVAGGPLPFRARRRSSIPGMPPRSTTSRWPSSRWASSPRPARPTRRRSS